MRTLTRDPATNGRTWRDPRDLDKRVSRSPYGLAAIVIERNSVIASTGPMLEPRAMLWHAGISNEGLSKTDDSRLFQKRFERAEIGTLRGLVSDDAVEIFFYIPDTSPMRLSSEGIGDPDVSPDTIELIAEYVRGHEQMRSAFPRGFNLKLNLTNYAGTWSYTDRQMHFHLASGFQAREFPS